MAAKTNETKKKGGKKADAKVAPAAAPAEEAVAVEETAPTENKAPEEETDHTAETVAAALAAQRDALFDELKTLVKEYNDSVEFAEFKRMKKIDAKISDKIAEYTAVAETECFNKLKVCDNIMVEAVKLMTFPTVKVKDNQNDDGSTTRIIEGVDKIIDLMKLHRNVFGGIGADSKWWNMVERLNMLFTCEAAISLGLDPKKVRDNIAMSQSSANLKLAAEEDLTDELMLGNIQKVVDAMLGEGYTVPEESLKYLRMTHEKGGRDPMTVVCSTHKGMRTQMMAVCHAAVTGDKYELAYKTKKAKN